MFFPLELFQSIVIDRQPEQAKVQYQVLQETKS